MSEENPNSDARLEPTPRTTVKRVARLGVYDRDAIYGILDEALICHVGFESDGQPFVMPTIHARLDDRLCIHGSPASRMMQCLHGGAPACVTVTLLDGIVLARSMMHHSMNYRSVVVLGAGTDIEDRDEKLAALKCISEHVVLGRWPDSRGPNERELAATAVVSFPLNEASAKVRSGPPIDDEDDYALPHWAGVIPFALEAGAPIPDPRLQTGIAAPKYAETYRRRAGNKSS